MNRRLQQDAGQFQRKLAGFASLLAGLALVIQTAGCASGRPSPLLIKRPQAPAVATNFAGGLKLRMVTYNIWGLPSWMTGAPKGRYPKIARELERLDPDVILLQEAWTARARKSAPAGGQWSVARAARQHTFFQQCGLLTLSKFPILGGEFRPFSRAAYPDRFVQKGVMKVTVRLPEGQALNIWNVHLKDGGAPEIRRSQVRELVSHVSAAEDGQVADVVGGDFNCTPDSPLFRELESAFGSSIQQREGAAPFVTWDGLSSKANAGRTFDYIFIRLRGPPQPIHADTHVAFKALNPKERLSDHFGIEATLNLLAPLTVAGGEDARFVGPAAPAMAAAQMLSGGGE